ncbi:MAG: phenylalanine--tRNA ligase subunit beta [Myxococcaceae bacterium]
MHISIQTLRSMVDLPNLSPQEIADKLTLGGLEVESIQSFEDDTILELKVTPNRPDALSHMGIARELAAMCHTRVTFLAPSIKELGASIHDLVQLNLLSKEACPRYACRVIEGVKIGPSPEWLSKKLLSIGIKPINNVVDITNWVLLERGQPLHAFDLDTLSKSKGRVAIKVRQAQPEEKLVTLDGKERILTPTDLVIADEEKAVALAGVMGGKNTEVSETTQNILLESAYFEPKGIRKTAKRLGLSTDASYRFERGTDPNGVITAIDRAAALIQEIAGGRIRRDALDIYPNPIEPLEISMRTQKLAQISGLPEPEPAELRTRFLSLGIETSGRGGHDAIKFRVPTFRPDITEEIDLIEEAMRLAGFDQIPTRIHFHKALSDKNLDLSLDKLERHIKTFLSHVGFFEAINYAFGSPREFEAFGSTEPLTLENPLGEEYSAMRQSLLPGLLNNIRHNLRQQIQKPCLYEMGVVFLGKNKAGHKPDMSTLSISDMGADSYAHEKLLCAGMAHQSDFFALKGILEALFASLKLTPEFKPLSQDLKFLHPGKSANLFLEDTCVGFLGMLHPSFGQDAQNCVFELDLDLLKSHCFKTVQVKSLPKFPGIQRDLALLLDESVPAGDILNLVRNFQALTSVLEDVRIFDVYQGKGIEPGKKSVAISIHLRDSEKTLTEEAIQVPIEVLKQELATKLGAVLRTN